MTTPILLANHSKRKVYKSSNTNPAAVTPSDEIVISGISGKFPNSDNVEELAYHLYNKVLYFYIILLYHLL